MLARLLVVGVALVLAGCPMKPSPPPVLGTWSGTVTEGDLTYGLTMILNEVAVGEVAGTAVYSGALSCTGTLTLLGGKKTRWYYREHVDDTGACADGGRIEVVAQGETVEWAWYRTDADATPDATATLTRDEQRLAGSD